jgi:hypothetical protein
MTNPSELITFHMPRDTGVLTLETFHEWSVAFATDKFKAKESNDEIVSFFNFHLRNGTVRIMEAKHRNPDEKYAIFDLVRAVCSVQELGVQQVSHVSEIWVATTSKEASDAMLAAGLQVRDMPDREDALMVSTYHIDGSARMTRWVVKLKQDAKKNVMLARDDLDLDKADYAGEATFFFGPPRRIDDIMKKGEPQ